MERIVGVTEFQRGVRAVLDEVVDKRVPCILTRGSRPRAVIIAYEDFARYRGLEERAVLARFDRLLERMEERNAAVDEQRVADDVEEARCIRAP